jgi:hypothetical protein
MLPLVSAVRAEAIAIQVVWSKDRARKVVLDAADVPSLVGFVHGIVVVQQH